MSKRIEIDSDALRILTDAAGTNSIKDLAIKAAVQKDWAEEETATDELREASEIGCQIYLDAIAARRRHE